jgi:hypothetical protein
MKYICTYKNGETKGQWIKSREYETVGELLNAMQPYLEKHPRTLVQYQPTR